MSEEREIFIVCTPDTAPRRCKCGRRALVDLKRYDDGFFYVVCPGADECGADPGWSSETPAAAIAMWNGHDR